MKKYITIIVFLLCTFLSHSQNNAPSIIVQSKNSVCAGKGQITVKIGKITGDIAIRLTPDIGSPILQNIQNITNKETSFLFKDLIESTYKIEVEVNNTLISNPDLEEEIKVKSETLDIAINLNDHCDGVEVSTKTISGFPTEYQFKLKHNGEILQGFSTKSSFVAPNYLFNNSISTTNKVVVVTAKDVCGNNTVSEVTLKNKAYQFQKIKHEFKFTSCKSINVRFLLNEHLKKPDSKNNKLSNFRYPLKFKYEVSFHGQTTTKSEVITTINRPEQVTESVPISLPNDIPFNGHILTGKLTVIDACNKIHVSNDTFELRRDKPSFSKGSIYCYYFLKYNSPFPIPGTKIKIIDAPIDPQTNKMVNLSDYIPSGLDHIEITSNMIKYHNGDSNNINNKFKIGAIKELPKGEYTFSEEVCGKKTISKTKFNFSIPIHWFYTHIVPGCKDNTADISLKLMEKHHTGKSIDAIEKVFVSDAPEEFINEYGPNYMVPLNYTPDYNNKDVPNGYAILENIPVGNYTITAEVKSVCYNRTNTITKSFSITEKNIKKEKVTFKIDELCDSFQIQSTDELNTSDITKKIETKIFRSTIILQRYNEKKGTWGSLDGSKSKTDFYYTKEPTTVYGRKIWERQPNSYQTNINLFINETISSKEINSKNAEFRLVHLYSNFKPGHLSDYNDSETYKACLQVLKRFKINFSSFKVTKYHMIRCTDDVNINFEIESDDASKIKFQLIEKNGVNISEKTNETESQLIKGLDIDTQYKIKVSNHCSSQVFNINTSTAKLPKFKLNRLCKGENGSLAITGTTGYDIKWLTSTDGESFEFDNNTKSTYSFTPYQPSIHNKLYKVKIYHKGSEVCSKGLIYNLKNIGKGIGIGTGTENYFTREEANTMEIISLSDYLLNDNSNNSGIWTAINNSIEIDSNKIDLRNLEKEFTYEFQYTLQNTCNDNVSTSVKITIVEPELNIPNVVTPNTDTNKTFFIKHKGIENIEIKIFNRWGNTVYTSSNYQNNWNGKTNRKGIAIVNRNNFLPNGTYFYELIAVVKGTGKILERKNWIYLNTNKQ